MTPSAIERASYEADVAAFVNLLERESEAHWAQAECAAAMAVKYGKQTAAMLATDTGLSAGYVRGLIAAAKAFPTPESRAQDLSFSHHRIAAMTGQPETWIDRATAAGWSVRQLSEAVKSSRDRIADAERARKAEERLVRLVREYNEHFTPITGQVVEIVWRELGR